MMTTAELERLARTRTTTTTTMMKGGYQKNHHHHHHHPNNKHYYRRNFSLMTILLTASAVVTLVTSFINLHLLSKVLQEQNQHSSMGNNNKIRAKKRPLGKQQFHPSKPSSLLSIPSSIENNNNNNNNNEKQLPEPTKQTPLFSGFRDDGTYYTEDINDPSFIDVQYNEEPIPNPSIIADGNSTFSACLLVMDDNHRLVEWLAYHYHVLPLRFLIVATDPRSRTSPTHVLNRWRRMGMTILEWNDFDFLKPTLAKHPIPDDAPLEDKRARHRIRQRQFFRKCLQVSKETYNRSYVALTDSDEFIMYNHKGGTKEAFEEWESKQLEFHMTQKYKKKRRIRPSQIPPPSPAEEGAMIRYIRQEEAAGIPFFQGPCISSPRLQIGAIEMSSLEIMNNSTTAAGEATSAMSSSTTSTPGAFFSSYLEKYKSMVDIDRFDTLRFNRHGPRQEFVNNRLAKVIIDVSRVDKFPDIETLHRPLKSLCPAPWRNEWDSGLRIYHYLGSWEAYTFRDDSRRGGEHSKELWYFKSAAFADEFDDNIHPWLGGFFAVHGAQKANELLLGAGLPRGFVNPIGHNFTYDYRHLHNIINNSTALNDPKKKEMQVAFDQFVLQMHNNNDNNNNFDEDDNNDNENHHTSSSAIEK